ncbi:hypothetical protein [Clostridium estertheticum]|uniref:hypothetical protein n=1 Tax=Clostridium estertheticum TaxID=238834 RepID=UPI001C7D9D4A|nr:hypothetical protein [Clostridium estertheticum]MBX4267167.1 hypothetical protein [Clostridium estertheticum]WLC91290.1 hypothetical protein KTC95_24100 [Clostridium estertheticum]
MTNLEIRTLIEEVAIEIGSENSFSWDGGQDGNYCFDNSLSMTDTEFSEKTVKLDSLSENVRTYLKDTDTQVSDIWE